MRRIDRVRAFLASRCAQEQRGFSAAEIADALGVSRQNVSADLNALARDGLVVKVPGRPVLFWDPTAWATAGGHPAADPFDKLIGSNQSLRQAVELAKAAVLYPPAGLHTLLIGPTGVGKSLMAEIMHAFAIATGRMPQTAPFIIFNCADYASNPQLLMGQLFGVARGAYTGADRDQEGLVERAHGGMLFLDEIHRLPPEGQEMLFSLIDKGVFRRLGETGAQRCARLMLIGATTEPPDSVLLSTFIRRIPMVITLPSLAQRTMEERFQFLKHLLSAEAEKIGLEIVVPQETLRILLEYECPGNIGQLKSDLQLSCARLFLSYLSERRGGRRPGSAVLQAAHLPNHVLRRVPPVRDRNPAVDEILDALGGPLIIHTASGSGSDLAGTDASPTDIYERIEQQLTELQRQGVDLQAATAQVQASIEREFQAFFARMRRLYRSHRRELGALVGTKVLHAVEKAIYLAGERLGRAIPERILYSLALHVHATLDRMAAGRPVDLGLSLAEPEGREAEVAREMIALLSAELGVALPRSDINLVAMLLRPEEEAGQPPRQQVGVIVVCHGRIASAMAEVANALTGGQGALAIDMPLDQSPKTVERQLIEIARSGRFEGGLLLLVDMGSLEQLGEAVATQTGLPVRTVTLVSPLLVVEAVRLAMMPEATLESVYQTVLSARLELLGRHGNSMRPWVILTFCYTGMGGAQILARIVRTEIGDRSPVEVVPTSLSAAADCNRLISTLLRTDRLLAVIGPFDPGISGVHYISTDELVRGNGRDRLRSILAETGIALSPGRLPEPRDTEEPLSQQMVTALSGHLRFANPHFAVPVIARAIHAMESYLHAPLEESVRVGLMLHLACFVDRMVESRLKATLETGKDDTDYCGPLPWLPNALRELSALFHLPLTRDELNRLTEILLGSVSMETAVSN